MEQVRVSLGLKMFSKSLACFWGSSFGLLRRNYIAGEHRTEVFDAYKLFVASRKPSMVSWGKFGFL